MAFTAHHRATKLNLISTAYLLGGSAEIITAKKALIMDSSGEFTSGLDSMSHGPPFGKGFALRVGKIPWQL